jgi:hypothetical protein
MLKTPAAPPMIRTDSSSAFAHNTMRVRVPAIVREVAARNPDYSPLIHDNLERLAAAMESNAPIPMLAQPAPDYTAWAALHAAYSPATWQDTAWFFAEFYAYRLLIEAVRWWETGRDPFAPAKAEEYAGGQPWTLLERALAAPDAAPDERLFRALTFALWANRIDLSLSSVAALGGESTHAADLLDDQRAAAVEQLLGATGVVHIVTDNAGSELTLDMALVGALLALTDAPVTLHVKLHPVFVSDAVPADVLALIGWLAAGRAGAAGVALGARLGAAFEAGRLRLAPDLFWNSPHPLWALPAYLAQTFTGARLVILKGDANYRRALGDALWPAELSFAEVTRYFPAPLLALRTLKSEPIVGLAPGAVARLDAEDAEWRVNGRRGVAQFRPQPQGA